MGYRLAFGLALIIPAFCISACTSGFSGSIKSEVKTAADLIQKKEDAKAAKLLDPVLASDPKDAKANYYSAIVDEHAGKLESALEKLNVAVDAEPGWADAYSQRAFVQTKLEHNDAALADANQAIRLEPNVALHHLRRALVGLNSKDWQLALESLESVEKLEPEKSKYWVAAYRAEAYLGMKDFKTAREMFDAAVKIAPPSQAVVYLRRANCLARAGEYAAAKADCMRFLKAHPSDASAHALLGALDAVNGNITGTRAEYAKAVGKATPSDLADTVDLGADYCGSVTELVDIYLGRKDAETASAILTRVESHRPLEPQEQYRLALANFELGRADRALSLLNSAIAMSPDYVPPRVELIHYYASQGLTSKAMELQREAYSVAKSASDKSAIAGAMIRKR